MPKKDKSGCSEYHVVTRRRFLGVSAAAMAALAAPAWLPRAAFAASDASDRDVIVSIFLRGGADALTLCVPHAEPEYHRLRPTLALPRPDSGQPFAVTDLDGFFGLPPAMASLAEPFGDENLLIVHACGTQDPTRSHFDAMYFTEVGQPRPPASLATGWLGRHLATSAPQRPEALLRAVGVNFSLPRTLIGAPKAVAVPDPRNYGLGGDEATEAERRAALEAMYAAAAEPLSSSAGRTVDTLDLLASIGFDSYQPAGGAVYPESEFGLALSATAALIKAQVGLEAVGIDLGGWDTHEVQEPREGQMALLMTDFAEGLTAFYRDIFADDHREVLVTAMSEFGRNVAENGSQGTDHGHGGLMMVLGDQVAGGRVLADWPGLAPEQLYEGQDLVATIDYRDILAEIVTGRLGNTDVRNVFPDPDFQPVNRGVLRVS